MGDNGENGQPKDITNFSDSEKLVTYVLGAGHDLKQMGSLAGSTGWHLMPKGIAAFDQLKASGYKPSDEDLLDVLIFFCDGIDAGVFLLFKKYRDGEFDESNIS